MKERSRFLEWSARVALLVALAMLVGFHALRALDRSRDEFEGAMIPVADRMRSEPVGPGWMTRSPYTLSPYGPSYFAIVAAVSAAGQRGPGDYLPGRWVSLAAAALTAGVVALAVRKSTGMTDPGLACGSLFLTFPSVAFWLHDYRVDALATFCSVSALVAPDFFRRGLLVSVLFVVVGSTVKQTVALAAVPVAVHLVLRGRWKIAATYLMAVGLLGLLAWGTLFWWSEGYYSRIGFLANRRAYFATQAMKTAARFVGDPLTVLAIVLGLSARVVGATSFAGSRYLTLAVTSTLISALLSGAEGASTNYFLEPAAMVAVVIGVHGIAPFLKAWPTRMGIALGISGAVLGAAIGVRGWSIRTSSSSGMDLSGARDKATTPYALVDWPYVQGAIAAGLTPVVNDPFFFKILVRNGAVNPAPLAEEMRRGRVSVLVLSRPAEEYGAGGGDWPTPIVDAILSEYISSGRVASGYLYVHRGPGGGGGPGPR